MCPIPISNSLKERTYNGGPKSMEALGVVNRNAARSALAAACIVAAVAVRMIPDVLDIACPQGFPGMVEG